MIEDGWKEGGYTEEGKWRGRMDVDERVNE
jgi:hypothetical protein